MKKFSTIFTKLLIGLTGLLCLVGIVLFLTPSQKEMMPIVLEWGQLSSFPTTATNISVITEGGMFTRSFHATFTAPKQDIESWIKNSPGFKEAKSEELSDNKIHYILTPGGGASWAEVTIDYNLNQVEIYVSWS